MANQISRRDFLRQMGIGLAGLGAWALTGGCQAIPIPTATVIPATITSTSTATVSATPMPPTATMIPLPTETSTPLPIATPTFSPKDIGQWVTPEMKAFLPNHEVKRGDISRKVAMLTYDDDGYTEQDIMTILDGLDKYKAKATFFFVGRGIKYRQNAIRRIVADGHQLACHGYYHDDPLTQLKSGKINEQFEAFLYDAADIVPGYRVRYFRAPFGEVDERVREVAAEWGLQHVLWTDNSNGWFEDGYQVVETVTPGAIILCHMFRYFDIQKTTDMARGLQDRGFTVETVDHGIDPHDRWEG